MGAQKKHGKGRIDRWYKLAKEKGYRARAAFKLIQLNKKYSFLQKSKVLIDLCAAPGSWCQVAAETMPVSSLIIGVDLAPIKPIPRAITFQSDITTDKCRSTIRQHLKTWKADTVLHDGAPNVGVAWVQDAFSQAELVLQAMKLATEFLVEGGTFVTKVFRSKDYNSLLWVFNQLFTNVEATKPPSSRNVSAEIFVVCRGFKAPKKIDPKFLDPRSVFAELADPTPDHEAKVFKPEVKKRKREGYEEGNYTLFKEASVREFIQTTDPIAVLGSLNRLNFDQNPNGDIALAAISQLPETTVEIRQCCADLKALGRKDFKILLKWRLRIREKFGLGPKKAAPNNIEQEEVAEIEPMDDELKEQEELRQLADKESSRKKRDRRRENERKQKEITRMQLHMTIPTELGLEQAGPKGEGALFSLRAVDRAGALSRVAKGRMGVIVEAEIKKKDRDEDDSDGESAVEHQDDSSEDELERQLDTLYEHYQEHKSEADAKTRAKRARMEEEGGVWEGVSDHPPSSDEDSELEEESSFDGFSDSENQEATSKTLTSGHGSGPTQDTGLTRRAEMFFEQEIFKSINGFDYEAEDKGVGLKLSNCSGDMGSGVKTTSPAVNGKTKAARRELAGQESDAQSEHLDAGSLAGGSSDAREDDFEVVKAARDGQDWEREEEPRKPGKLDIDIITAEAMTLAHKVASGEMTRAQLMDDGFNKYTFRDRDGLPEWFLDDEDKHSRPHRPITAAGAAAIKEKLRALNARPIKKVREAKDRKKYKAAQRLEKLRKKSALLADDEDMTEKDKAQTIGKLMSKAAKKKPKPQVKVVVARGGNRGIMGRPRGVKGRYKIVDARLKKDVRAQKRLAKRQK
ncbi:MAG: AdoMet-dependent rRNA methyltransferase spb1 [Phylliscum demangeonii]|nr:MAG: AdoMet-dependent rRNA methyltransferase spb1 [Phylliscum demangeonii]